MKIDFEFEYKGVVHKDAFTLPDTIEFTEAQIAEFTQKAIQESLAVISYVPPEDVNPVITE